MKSHQLKRVLSMILVVAMLAGFYVPGVQAASTGLSWKESDQEIKWDMTDRKAETYVEETCNPADIVRVSIVLEDKPTVQAGYSTQSIGQNPQAMAYSRQLRAQQDATAQLISTQVLGGQKLDVVWNLTLVGNIISAEVPYGKITAISRVEGVRDVFVENIYEPCVVNREENVAQPQMYSSLGMTGSSRIWTNGYTGAGSRIAVIDTGTDIDHQSLDSGAFVYALQQNAGAAGLSYSEYVEKLDLLDTAEISSVLQDLNIYEKIGSLSASKLYLNEKLPFAANYIDHNLVVNHTSDQQGEHGSHVAGIAAANRFIPKNSSYVDALETVMMAGMAPDAQLITMKVFGSYGGPSDADYLAAVEDAILLGCDSVNLSLGTSVAGTGFSPYYQSVLDYMTTTDTVVVASAGNAGAWPEASLFSYLYSDDVSLDTVGSPGSFSSFFTVASVDNDGGVGYAFRVADKNFAYADSADNGYCEYLTTLDTSGKGTGTEYDYVFIDGLGAYDDYKGMNLNGKVVFCSRGDLNFADKANNAVQQGAAAVVVYNNVDEGLFGMNMSGYNYNNPCVSITQADANTIRSASVAQTTAGGLTYYTGKLTIYGKPVAVSYHSKYYTMSSFSSWGVPGDLTLKPEITAPGGQIYSLNGRNYYNGSYYGGSDQYELMSGTSMAAPAVTGMAALLSQYIREKGLAEQEGMKVRALAQSLLMSTAVPMYEENSGGNYYSLLKQGAGLARVDLATAAGSYILVDGQPDGKVKAELGDDPNRTGVYEFSFTINNLNGKAEDYVLSADLFCQDNFEYQPGSEVYLLDYWTKNLAAISTFSVNGREITGSGDLPDYDLNNDGVTNADDADYLLEYLLGNETVIYGQSDVSGDGKVNSYDAHVLLALLENTGGFVTVPANGSVTVDVKLALTSECKAMLDSQYANGTYVEAYVYAEAVADEEGVAGTVHSIPVLAFYGNWSDPTMFDHGSYVELEYNATEFAPYLYREIGSGNCVTIDYGDGQEYYFGGNPFLQDDRYMPERNAFNSEDASKLVAQYFTLIRVSTDTDIQVRNADTGEVYFSRELGMIYPAYYHTNLGAWQDLQQRAALNWTGKDNAGKPLPEGTNVEVVVRAVPEYYRNADGTHDDSALGDGVYMTTWMTIDNTAPVIRNMKLVDTILTITVQDNEYIAAVALMDISGNNVLAADNPNQTAEDAVVTVDLDLTGMIGKTFLLAAYDYAGNVTTQNITLELPEVERPYLTVVDAESNTYYGLEIDGSSLKLAAGSRGAIQAAEFVDGYVFEISDGDQLYVAPNDDLNNFRYLVDLDPHDVYGITSFCDLAYNYADGKLYGLFYCEANEETTSVLCTIDMFSGAMTVLGQMPVDVNTLAIDDNGNFYSAEYGSSNLYTYTIDDLATTGGLTLVGNMGYYRSTTASSMAWDHDKDTLYWAYPNTLLTLSTTNAVPTLRHYNNFHMVGLYIVPETYGDRFAPTTRVTGVTLNRTESSTIVGGTLSLNAQVCPWNVTDHSITWSSSNPAVATVDESGLVTGISIGTSVITAVSNLDSSKKASCTVTVTNLNKTLNGLVWDEEGTVWWSSFNTDTLPSYTRKAAVTNNLPLAATAVVDGRLYASTLDASNGLSDLYTVDPKSFEMKLVGGSTTVCYTDLTYAPSLGYLFGTYFNYILLVDPSTGEYMGAWDWTGSESHNLAGITYYGTEYNSYYNAYVDYFLILDEMGDVYLDAFIFLNGEYYYFNGMEDGFVANIGQAVDTPYFQGFHYDGSYTYWARFSEMENVVQLLVWDCDDTGAVNTVGQFPVGVWPVGGLYSDTELISAGALANGFDWADVSPNAMVTEPEPVSIRKSAAGGLNAVSGQPVVAPNSEGEYDQDARQVIVTLTPAAELNGSTNGRMTVTYNPGELRLVSVTGTTTAFAYTLEEGAVEVAFAGAAEMNGDAAVATLTFEVIESGEHVISVLHTEDGDGPCGKEEQLTVASGCSHNYKAVVTEPTCQAGGYTTYTCTKCGDSYVDDYTDPVKHVYEDGPCKWCGIRWISGTTSLNGTIDLNIYVALSDELLYDPDTFIRFIHSGVTVDVPVSEGIESLKNNTTCYRYSCEIFAKQVADTVTVQVMNENGPVGDALEYSVMQYCLNQIKKSTNQELVAVCKAMLNYAAAAQKSFNYNPGSLANASLSEADKVLPNVDASAYKYSNTGSEDGIKASSATLMLEAEVKIRVYFKLTGDKTIDEYTFTIDGKEVGIQQNDKGYYIETDGIIAKQLDEMHEFSVGGITVNYGALSYVNSKLTSSKETELNKNLAKALYAYYAAAEAYLG